jgi:hypothetical protein
MEPPCVGLHDCRLNLVRRRNGPRGAPRKNASLVSRDAPLLEHAGIHPFAIRVLAEAQQEGSFDPGAGGEPNAAALRPAAAQAPPRLRCRIPRHAIRVIAPIAMAQPSIISTTNKRACSLMALTVLTRCAHRRQTASRFRRGARRTTLAPSAPRTPQADRRCPRWRSNACRNRGWREPALNRRPAGGGCGEARQEDLRCLPAHARCARHSLK